MSARDDMILNAVAGRRASSKGWVRGNCPLCELRTGKPDRKQCLGLYVPTGKWHCFRCGSGGLLLVPDDIAMTAPRPPTPEEEIERKKAMQPPEGFWPLFDDANIDSISGIEPREYMRDRGFPDDVCREAGVGAVYDGKLNGRVIVPILATDDDAWLGWSARAWFPNPMRKVLYPTGMLRGQILYNHRAIFEKTERPVLVTEGVFDAMSVWPDAVACLGKPTQYQREALLAATRPVVVVLDGDAHREAEALGMLLKFNGLRAGSVHLPPGLDPNTVDRSALEKAAEQAAATGDHVWLSTTTT